MIWATITQVIFFKLGGFIDAPFRLRIRFWETKQEADYDFSTYEGWICASWLQEEIINIDTPGRFELPRRYACRFIEVTVMFSPKDIKLFDYGFRAETSADISKLSECHTGDKTLDQIDKLSKKAMLALVYSFALDKLIPVLGQFDKEAAMPLKDELSALRHELKNKYYNKENGVFTNNGQVSVLMQAWMILAGTVEADEARNALKSALESTEAIQPVTPYGHHYVTEAIFKLGDTEWGFDYIKKIWGEMLEWSGDTFREIFKSNDPDFSPYGNRIINSMCHIRSSTPSCFIENTNNKAIKPKRPCLSAQGRFRFLIKQLCVAVT